MQIWQYQSRLECTTLLSDPELCHGVNPNTDQNWWIRTNWTSRPSLSSPLPPPRTSLRYFAVVLLKTYRDASAGQQVQCNLTRTSCGVVYYYCQCKPSVGNHWRSLQKLPSNDEYCEHGHMRHSPQLHRNSYSTSLQFTASSAIWTSPQHQCTELFPHLPTQSSGNRQVTHNVWQIRLFHVRNSIDLQWYTPIQCRVPESCPAPLAPVVIRINSVRYSCIVQRASKTHGHQLGRSLGDFVHLSASLRPLVAIKSFLAARAGSNESCIFDLVHVHRRRYPASCNCAAKPKRIHTAAGSAFHTSTCFFSSIIPPFPRRTRSTILYKDCSTWTWKNANALLELGCRAMQKWHKNC